MTQEIIGLTLQSRVFARANAKSGAIKRMDCEKTESIEGDCQLERCSICLIDSKIQLLDDTLRIGSEIRILEVNMMEKWLPYSNFCNNGREHDDLDKAIEIFESICNDGRKEPMVVVSNNRWVACFQKIAFELMR